MCNFRKTSLFALIFATLNIYGQEASSIGTTYLDDMVDMFRIDSMFILHRCKDYYILDYCPSSYPIVNREVNDTYFAELEVPFWVNKLSDFGYPELPYFSYAFQLFNNTDSVEVVAIQLDECNSSSVLSWSELMETDYSSEFPEYESYSGLQYMYMPVDLCPLPNSCVGNYNADYYSGADLSWNSMYNVYDVSVSSFFNTKGAHINVYPYRYVPQSQSLEILPPTRFYIKCYCPDIFDTNVPCGNLYNDVWIETISSGDIETMSYYDCYSQDDWRNIHPQTDKGSYLIIYEDTFENQLDEFIIHKMECGYNVVTECVSSYCTDSLARFAYIKNIIRQNYYDLGDLKYVLLVGSETAIPPGTGINIKRIYDSRFYDDYIMQSKNPPSDKYYSCFEATNDKELFSKVIVGRWLVYDDSELQLIVNKTIDQEYRMPPAINAALYSGVDGERSYITRRFNADCEFAKYELERVNFSVNYTIGDIFLNESYNHFLEPLYNEQFLFWAYRGHGGVDYLCSPYNIYTYRFVSNNGGYTTYTPFSMAFACLTGSYYMYSFAKGILPLYDNGVTLFLGSSTFSYSVDNGNLFREVIKSIARSYNQSLNMPIGIIINDAMQKYYTSNKKKSNIQQQYKRYNIFGDPSLYMLGLNRLTNDPNSVNDYLTCINSSFTLLYQDIVYTLLYR